MLNILQLRISQKILLLVVGLALGFVVIGLAFFAQVSTEKSIVQQHKAMRDMEIQLSSMQWAVIEQNRDIEELKAGRSDAVNTKRLLAVNQFLEKLQKLNTQNFIGITQDDIQTMSVYLNTQKNIHLDIAKQIQSMVNHLQVPYKAGMDQAQNTLLTLGGIEALQQFILIRRWENPTSTMLDQMADSALPVAVTQLKTLIGESDMPDSSKATLAVALDNYLMSATPYVNTLEEFQKSIYELKTSGNQIFVAVNKLSELMHERVAKNELSAAQRSHFAMLVFVALALCVLVLMAMGVYFIYRSVTQPLMHMQSVIQKVNEGDFSARVKWIPQDELGDLSKAFNSLLDDRIHYLEMQSAENDQLNNSIIDLIKTVAKIAQKDLTIKVPVSSDITGTVSDAINLLTSETAKTLTQVKDVSDLLNTLAERLYSQANIVVRASFDERKHVLAAGKALSDSAHTMQEIALKASHADDIAAKAIGDTQAASDTVLQTIKAIQTIRETISETERRMKRLGERSQEISSIVHVINTIAERTHILALNASMQAAAAGDAGKGFGVVADEVQRLAENAREATAEVAGLVNSIRLETSDTVNVMNKLINDVTEGSRLGEQAKKSMLDTRQATEALVGLVKTISSEAALQSNISNKLRDRAMIIRHFTEKTSLALQQTKSDVEHLKQFAEILIERVNVFILPEHYAAPVLQDTVEEPKKPKLASRVDDLLEMAP